MEKSIEFVEKIKDLELNVLNLTDKIEIIEHQMSDIKKTYICDILETFDDKGKPVYSNEQKRDIRLSEVLKDDDVYNRLVDELKQINREKQSNLIDIKYYNNMLKIRISFAEYITKIK